MWHRFGFSGDVHLRRIHYVLVSQGEEGESVLKPGNLDLEVNAERLAGSAVRSGQTLQVDFISAILASIALL